MPNVRDVFSALLYGGKDYLEGQNLAMQYRALQEQQAAEQARQQERLRMAQTQLEEAQATDRLTRAAKKLDIEVAQERLRQLQAEPSQAEQEYQQLVRKVNALGANRLPAPPEWQAAYEGLAATLPGQEGYQAPTTVPLPDQPTAEQLYQALGQYQPQPGETFEMPELGITRRGPAIVSELDKARLVEQEIDNYEKLLNIENLPEEIQLRLRDARAKTQRAENEAVASGWADDTARMAYYKAVREYGRIGQEIAYHTEADPKRLQAIDDTHKMIEWLLGTEKPALLDLKKAASEAAASQTAATPGAITPATVFGRLFSLAMGATPANLPEVERTIEASKGLKPDDKVLLRSTAKAQAKKAKPQGPLDYSLLGGDAGVDMWRE